MKKSTQLKEAFWSILLLFAVLLPAAASGAAQDRGEKVKWLKEHTLPLRSLDPQDEDFSDLMPLVQVIGSARIVQLGENTHGDGAAFLAKGRLIRFFHQVMGFDVLAWEAGFFDCRLVDAAIRSEMPIAEAASQGLYRIWCRSAQVMPVLEYARASQRTPSPLTIAGFDCRVSTPAAREKLFPEFIFSFFDRLDPHLLSAKDREDFLTMSLRLVPADYFRFPEKRDFNPEVARRLVDVLDRNQEKMAAYAGIREIAYVRQALVSFLNMGRALRESGAPPAENESEAREIKDRYSRDTAMAENLLWLYRTYFPDRKILVWAHNYHIARDVTLAGVTLTPEQQSKWNQLKNIGPHGRRLSRELGDRVYTIGVTGYRGSWGYVEEEPAALLPSEPGSLGELLHQVGQSYLFLDLKGVAPTHWLRQAIPGRFYFWESQTVSWSRLYDGLLFIDTMTPSTPLHR
jgi:erythromycin esterase